MEELYLFDREENLLGIVPAEDLYAHEQEVELNKFIQIFLTKRYDVVTESAYYIGHKDIDDNQTFQLYRPTMIRTENGVMDIEGIHTFFDEMKSNGYIKDKRPTNASVYTALNIILEGSRWQIGNINSSALGTATFYYQSRLSAFWDFIEAWGVEFKIRMTFSNGKITGRYVDIYDRISKDNGKWFERGDKLVKTVMEEQRAEIYTALLGRGRGEEKFDENGQSTGGFGRKITFEDVEWKKENGDPVDKPLGQPFVELPEATAIYGFPGGQPRIGIIEMDNIEDPEILLSEVYEQLLISCRPKRELQAQALETGLTELGETVAIIDDETGIRYKTRVFKLRRNFLNKLDKTFTFGERLTSSRAERSVQIQRQIKKQEERTETWMNGLLEAYTSIYFNADGYNYKLDAGNEFGLPGGFYSFNAPIDENPTKMIYMGAGMLAISNSKDAQGNWIMKTFGTGDGFTADLMTAGRLDAERVRITNGDTDILWVDSGTGEVVMNISKMTINAIPVATKEDLDAIELTPGKSAYDIAKENGFVGTEAQWLESLQGQDGSNGTPGAKGADGKTSYLHIAYANSEDGSAGFSTKVATGKAFIGQYTDFELEDSDDYTKYTWSKFKGENGYTPVKGTDYFDGVDGQDGSDGESSFLWVRYSQNPNGYPMTTNPTNAVYIGVATTQSSVEPTDYTKFKWALIRGKDGTPGESGADGKTSYLHIKYSNDGGQTFTANNGEAVGEWIGTYVDFVKDDSTLVSAYTWNKVKGEQGETGPKGATGSRGPKGDVGTSVSSVTEYYLATSLSSGVTESTDGWTTSIQTMTPTNKYLWNYEKINFSDGTDQPTIPVIIGVYGDKGSTGSTGATGRSITGITEHYLATDLATGVTRSTSGWTTTMQPTTETKRYLWNYETITWSSGTTTTYVEPIIIGVHGLQGPKGDTGPKGATGSQGPKGDVGTSVSSVTEYYLATASSTGVTTSTAGWSTSMQPMTETNKYLWNYEQINFSDNTSQPTIPVIIGVYGDKGQTGSTGATGRSITAIQEYYLATSASTGVTRTTSGWTTAMQTTEPTKKYLWNYEKITWSSGTTTTYVEPIIIGIHGEQGPQGPQGIQGPKGATGSQGPQGNVGVGVTSITEHYLATSASSGVTTATSGWTTTIQTMDATKKYLWNYEKINFSDNTSQPTIPVIIGVYGDKGATGSTGPTGATGRSITAITEHYLATNSATGVTRTTSGWTTTMQTTTPEKRYLWNYETITWSSGTTPTYVDPIVIGVHGEQGPQGKQGIQGPTGANGTSQYIHIRYSTASNGNPMTDKPSASTKYIGIANTTSSTAPSGYASYTWSLYKGEKGDQGVQGPPGANGQPTYTWIKYADTDTGVGMSDSPSGKKYIGMAFNKTTQTEGTTASQYTWSLMPQNIEVGAKNLLLKSNEEITNSLYPIATYKMSEKMIVGQEYTIRLWGTLGAGKTNFTPYLNGGSISLGALKNNGDGTFSATFVGKDSGVTTGDILHIYPFASTTVVNSTITKIKLEKGSLATDWTEAPEDVEARISDKASNESLNEVASGIGEIKNDLIENYAGIGDIQRLDEAMIASNAAIEEARADSIKDINGINNRTAILEQNFGDYAVDWNFIRTSVRLADEGVRISKAGEKTGVLIQNNKISFVSDDNEVAYITGSELYITQGTFLDNVKIGQHRVSTLPSDKTITVIRYEG